jgi:hypothetical protein
MKKIVFVAAIATMLAGCNAPGLKSPQKKIDDAEIVCRDNVEYLYIPVSGYATALTPHLKVDGTPYTC